MGRFIEGADRRQAALLPEAIDGYVGEGKGPLWVPRPSSGCHAMRHRSFSHSLQRKRKSGAWPEC